MSTNKTEFMLLFRGGRWDKGMSDDELERVMNRMMAWLKGLQDQGRVKGSQALGSEARTVSRSSGRMVADGPFVESKEAVGGYLVVEAESMDEAAGIAAACPTLEYGISVEVRPVAIECPCFERIKHRLVLQTA